MGLITDLIKNGILNGQVDSEKTSLKISKSDQDKLRQGNAVLIEDSSGQFIVKIKESSLNKSNLTNDDFDIRQIENPRAAKNQIEL